MFLRQPTRLALVFLLVACSHAPLNKHRDATADLRRAEQNSFKRTKISGNGSIAWRSDSPKRNLAAAAILLVQWPDKLRMEVNDPIGNRLALLVVNGEEAWWESEGQAVIHSKHGLKPLLNLPYSGRDLVKVFLARPEFKGFSLSDEGEGELVFLRGQEKLVVNGRLADPELWTVLLEGGQSLRVDFEDYLTRSGVDIPGTMRLTWTVPGQQNNSLLWAWRDWEPSLPDNPTLFQIPKSASHGQAVKSF